MKARCSRCPRKIQVRKDGTLHVHLFANRNGQVLTTKCPGGGEPPEPVCPQCGLAGCLEER